MALVSIALSENDDIARIDVGEGAKAIAERGPLTLRPQKVKKPSPADSVAADLIQLAVPGRTVLIQEGSTINAQADPGPAVVRDESVNFDRLILPLVVRAPAAGDRFNSLGIGNKKQALADLFRAKRVPRDQRLLTPLVCDQEDIVRVVVHRIAERVNVTEQTKHMVCLKWAKSVE